MSLSFFVPGDPQAQGGMRAVPRKGGPPGSTVMISTGSKDLKPWRAKITEVAQWAMNLQRWHMAQDGPVRVEIEFWLPMPQSRPAATRRLGVAHHATRKDIDKLERAVLDSLTKAGVYSDDAQVAVLVASKYEVADHRLCGAQIDVRELGAESHDVLMGALSRRMTGTS